MKLTSFRYHNGPARVGVSLDGEVVLDLAAAHALILDQTRRTDGETESLPSSMLELLDLGTEGLGVARSVVESVRGREDLLDTTVAGKPIALPQSAVTLVSPVPNPRKFIGIGLNYRGHTDEQNIKIPKNPLIFSKFATSLIGHGQPISYPQVSQQLDYEAELAVVIGTRGRDIPESSALDYVAGYTICNDVTARDVQLADRQWLRGKTPDSITPVGPWIVTTDELPNPSDLSLTLTLNGEVLQSARTSQMIWDVAFLISFLSEAITLEPGDIIATGTPDGTGFARKPPVFMQPGDRVQVELEGVGVLANEVRA